MKRTSFVRKQQFFRLSLLVAILVFVNILASPLIKRIDLTDDQRFTLADSTKEMLRHLPGNIFVSVYLKADDLGSDYQRLADATRELLDEFRVYAGSKLQYQFEDVLSGKNEEDKKKLFKDFFSRGMAPVSINASSTDAYSIKTVIPSAWVTINGANGYPVNLAKNVEGIVSEGTLNTSVAQLENQFATVIRSIAYPRRPLLGYISGHGELEPAFTADLDTSLKMFYDIKTIDLPHVYHIDPKYACVIVAKPRGTFEEKELFLLDQYLMHGGHVLWLAETMNAELDSMWRSRKLSFLATPYPLPLNDLLFHYGLRLNIDLVQDEVCNPVPLPVGYQDKQMQFQLFPNFYYPVLIPDLNHPILKSIDRIAGRFMSSIDTVRSGEVKKTVLLHTSEHSRTVGNGPWEVDYKEFKTPPNDLSYNKKNLITGLLLEGSFTSAFRNNVSHRLLTIWQDSLHQTFLEKSSSTRMIVLSDGDLIKNGLDRNGNPGSLGFYAYTKELFANKNFLLNCIDYLTGYTGNMETRSKVVKLRLLDAEKIKQEKTKWQVMNMALPLVFVLLFAFVFTLVRQLRYARK